MDYNNKIEEITKSAMAVATTYSNKLIAPEHLLFGILQLKDFKLCDILLAYEITSDIIGDYISSQKNIILEDTELQFTVESSNVLQQAYEFSKQANMNVSPEHILLALFVVDTKFLNFMESTYKIDRKKISEEIANQMENDLKSELPAEILELGTDLNKLASQGKIDNIIGRESQIQKMIEILCQKNKNSPLIIGEAGVGKTAIVEYLAKLIYEKKVPEFLQDKIIFSLNMGLLVSNTKYRGELEEKLTKFIEICKSNPRIIVFVDEIHTIISSGTDSGEISPANILKPPLARGEIAIIGATTNKEYKKFIEKDNAFSRRFQMIDVPEPSKEDTLKILNFVRKSFENHFGVNITDEALLTCVNLTDKYVKNRYFPDKAIDVIDATCARNKCLQEDIREKKRKLIRLKESLEGMKYDFTKRYEIENIKKEIDELEKDTKKITNVIDEEDISIIVSEITKIPLSQMKAGEVKMLLNLEKTIGKRIIGHSAVIEKIANAIRRNRVGLKNENKPIGSFLFLGPSGVGKTEIAKTLAETMFGDRKKLIRINMNEYSETNTINKLIGAPMGYAGCEEGGVLTNAVLKQPYSVIVFDEFEKASKEVCNVLLTALDDGFIMDNSGKKVDFTNTIMIMTSNEGLDKLKNLTDEEFEEILNKDNYENLFLESAKSKFNLELLNRFDCINVFRPLSKIELAKIVNLLLTQINNNQVVKENDLKIKITKSAIYKIIDIKGIKLLNGVRPIKNLLEQTVIDKLSNSTINQELNFKKLVIIDLIDGEISLRYE